MGRFFMRNHMRPINAATAAATLCALAALPVHADDTVPWNTVRVGLYDVMYHATADDLSGPFTPPGLSVGIKDVNTIYFGYVRKLSTHFVAELALGAPPLTTTVGKGPASVGSVPYNGQEIVKVRWLAPTALLEYQFFDDSSRVRPYIGFGANYTVFYDRRSTAAGNAASGGPTKVSMNNSFGPAGTVGVTWNPWGPLELNLSYSASIVTSRITTDTAGVLRTTKVQFLPAPLVFSVGYKF